jgi:starch phosphorylase
MATTRPKGPFCAFNHWPAGQDLKNRILWHIESSQGRDPQRADQRDACKALSYAVRDLLVEKWLRTQKENYARRRKRVYYLSLEFLIGRSLGNSLINLGMHEEGSRALEELGYEMEEIREQEEDAALGNGGLGRLAACFLDSMATLGIPAYGYGIRYEYGLFRQKLVDGFQVESPDNWLRYGTPWEFARPDYLHPVRFYGRVLSFTDEAGRYRVEWVDTEEVMAMACDHLVPGFDNEHVINTRLWTAHASRELDLSLFNSGDYISAVHGKVESETISKVLYPPDEVEQGRELRLKQQYFFVAATFQDIFRRYKKHNTSFDRFSDEVAVQLNETHPAIAIPELMRLLVDEEGLSWDQAWNLCIETFAYTNHTLMPEALETWPVSLLGRVLPRHLEIIYEINRRFLAEVAARYPCQPEKLSRMSLIGEGRVKNVRMAHLAIVGSHSVNGVARVHTRLLEDRLFRDFAEFFSGRFNCKTNGITPRRWLLKCNPGLAGLIIETIGGEWVTDLDHLRQLEPYAENSAFREKWRRIKQENKERLRGVICAACGLDVDPASLFDVQVKRIHEYKRQLLNVLHVITRYHRLLADHRAQTVARTFVFAGKAAPSYNQAKLIVKLINAVAAVVNNDPRTAGRLQVAFIPDYGVSLAEKIIPAADLSEQISTAGTEASGTGNMKFALNGALTIGTLDGANIEIRDEVGEENMFIFGLTVAEAEREQQYPTRSPRQIYEADAEIKRTVDSIARGEFSNGDQELFRPIVGALLAPKDRYLLLQDLEDYLRCQAEVDRAFEDQEEWTKKSILNVARMGRFSSDRTVREYAEEIWGVRVD